MRGGRAMEPSGANVPRCRNSLGAETRRETPRQEEATERVLSGYSSSWATIHASRVQRTWISSFYTLPFGGDVYPRFSISIHVPLASSVYIFSQKPSSGLDRYL